MQSKIRTLTIPLLVITLFSAQLTSPVHANTWVGNDDGEFDVGSPGYPLHVGLRESFQRPMNWSSSPPSNLVSMQYNPDQVSSLLGQWGGQWFQTVIISNVNGCADFSIQVYNLITGGKLVWRADQAASPCSTNYFTPGAVWTIQEDMLSSQSRSIVDVYFSISAGTTSFSYTLYPSPSPSNWIWERSNLCWCGTDSGSTTFTSAFGGSTTYSDLTLNAIDPPIAISTSENSNMPYGTFQNAGTQNMYQTFGWIDFNQFSPDWADVTNDGIINIADMSTLSLYYHSPCNNWQSTPQACYFDINQDGSVDVGDLGVMANLNHKTTFMGVGLQMYTLDLAWKNNCGLVSYSSYCTFYWANH